MGHEDGTFAYPETQPGGGSAALRRQLSLLREFVEGFDFVRMAPDAEVVRGGVPADVGAFSLGEAGIQYGVYLCQMGDEPRTPAPVHLGLHLPEGAYRAEWFDPASGEVTRAELLDHRGGDAQLPSPPFAQDAALRVLAVR